MSQQKIKINNIEIWQPDSDLSYGFATTSTEDSGRTQDGIMHNSVMFTVEQWGYQATGVPMSAVSQILQQIVGKRQFTLFAFSPYYGEWRSATVYVAEGSLTIKTLEDGYEKADLSFNMTGVNPI